MLQAALRPEPLPFPIAAEYPLVLAADAAMLSYCLGHGVDVVAHANLWPRAALTREGRAVKIGLVGNVATDARRRGQGLMRNLFEHLERRAAEQELTALYLWSDLLGFYQNLGYRSCGTELRFAYGRALEESTRSAPARGLALIAADQVDEPLAAALLARRLPHLPTLARTPQELRAQLRIPLTQLYLAEIDGDLAGFWVIGKGYDMGGVVHEWGATSPAVALAGLGELLATTGHETLTLLAPGSMAASWREPLTAAAEALEEHPMALMKPLGSTVALAELEGLFIWGLDSI
jgi:GNAT superfamily N-acetyltransferase